MLRAKLFNNHYWESKPAVIITFFLLLIRANEIIIECEIMLRRKGELTSYKIIIFSYY